MNKQIQHVLEYFKPSVQGNVIRGVKIVGLKSRNGYAYPAEVLARAVGLYEGAPVFLMHGDTREKKRGSRMLRDHFGNLENVKDNGEGLFGDLNVKSSHPLAVQVLEEALTASFGLSHNAIVELNEDGSQVTNILEVNSVDLVDDPATTHNLFEEGKVAEPNWADNMIKIIGKLDELIAANDGKIRVPVTEGKRPEYNREKLPLQKVKRLVALENVEEGGSPVGDTHEDFMGAVRGFSLK